MTLLGIDWGEAKIGLAITQGKFAEPYGVIRYQDTAILSEALKKIIEKENVDKIVIGISEGKSGAKAKAFGEEILEVLRLKVIYFDETLSTSQAQELSRQAGIRRKRRRALEDAFAASVMLQSYLDSNLDSNV